MTGETINPRAYLVYGPQGWPTQHATAREAIAAARRLIWCDPAEDTQRAQALERGDRVSLCYGFATVEIHPPRASEPGPVGDQYLIPGVPPVRVDKKGQGRLF